MMKVERYNETEYDKASEFGFMLGYKVVSSQRKIA